MNICENPAAINHHRISNDHQTDVVRRVQIIRTLYNEAHITNTTRPDPGPSPTKNTDYMLHQLSSQYCTQVVTAQSGGHYYARLLCLPVNDEFLDHTRVTIPNTTVSYAYQVIDRGKHKQYYTVFT